MTFPGVAVTSKRWRQQAHQQQTARNGRYKWITSLWLLSKIFISNGLAAPGQQYRVQHGVSVLRLGWGARLTLLYVSAIKV